MMEAATTFEELTLVTKPGLTLERLNLSTEKMLCCEKRKKQHYTMMWLQLVAESKVMEQGGKSMTQTNYGDYRGKGVKVLTSSKCRF
jgi:hypothetical protein